MKKFINKLVEIFPIIFYYIVWCLGIITFLSISYIMLNERDIAKYISPLGILLSAFLAALSVIKSIDNTKKMNKESKISQKNINILHLDFILLDIYRQIKFMKLEIPHLLEKHESSINQYKKDKKINIEAIQDVENNFVLKHIRRLESEKKDLINKLNEYIVKTLIDRVSQLSHRKIQLEDKEVLNALDEGQRIILFEISGNLVNLEQLLSHLKNYQSSKLFVFNEQICSLFDSIIKWIEFLKNDLNKNNPNSRILSINEYEEIICKVQEKQNKEESFKEK